MLDKADAIRIAKKLRAEVRKKDNAHDIAEVFHNGLLIAKFGIRRSSRKGIGHDFIPKEIYATPHVCKGLAICTVSRGQWMAMMREKGKIED